ncbi:uncharacterized protein N7511_006679 [Penicillium nucicola]|uniref:uncharacterized protein n=1 Tax=Penicillium nucicola TaxID=1850975 RepID=UPI0025451D45|nr:uncharacterized protein N7511_006679 [Penicillium nucicola]KAJ5757985.1 hypothetical protein N7511_006679 [Penicillium nucicola]
MEQPRHVGDLADELLSEILLFLLEPTPRALNGGIHANGSGNAIEYGEASDLDRFRLVCKRFMRIGTPHKFARFSLRFSERGFRRLEQLLEMQLACYVKTLTYMVRPFYQGSGTNFQPRTGWTRVLRTLSTQNNALSQLHNRRFQEQTSLLETNYDKAQLIHAIAAFTSLQDIQLLRLQDDPDERLVEYIRNHHHNAQTQPANTISLDWSPACTRAVTNLGIALLSSKSHSIRFTAPQISPEATLQLLRAPATTLSEMGTRLTSLDINFHSTNDNITPTMADLSGIFHRFFLAAKNLIAIHIGFLGKTPLDLDLESVFHDIRWKTLRKLSIQGWRLHASEIIDLARRHRFQLRDLGLVGIYLRAGGKWSDVLSFLREEMDQLERLELREIDYAAYFDLVFGSNVGVEVFDDYPLPVQVPSSLDVAAAAEAEGRASAGPGLGFGPDGPSGRIGRYGRVSVERVWVLGAEGLGDDGMHVLHEQMPLWEAWVLTGDVRTRRNGNGSGNRNENGRVHGWSI